MTTVGADVENLASHGLSSSDIEVVRRWFGDVIPADDAPEALHWAFVMLPWERIWPILLRWYSTGLVRGGDLGDADLRAVGALLRDVPCCADAVAVRTPVRALLVAMADNPEVPYVKISPKTGLCLDPDAPACVSMWVGADAVTCAVEYAAQGSKSARLLAEACMTVFWTMEDFGSTDANKAALADAKRRRIPRDLVDTPAAVTIDQGMRLVMGELCAYLRTWTDPHGWL